VQPAEELRWELEQLKPSQLRRWALGAGASVEQMEGAEDADAPREALMALTALLEAKA